MINVPISQSIRFRPINSDRFNFDNIFEANNPRIKGAFVQYVGENDIKIQVATDEGERAVSMYVLDSGVYTDLGVPVSSVVRGVTYCEFTFDAATYAGKECQLEVRRIDILASTETAVYLSEPFTVEDQPLYYKLEWFNIENNFAINYGTGIVHQLFVNARMKMQTMGGEASIYSNQGEDVKLKEIVSRIFYFECDVPDYMAEQITLAMAHDNFFVNGVQMVVNKKAVITPRGSSNIVSFAAELKQKTVIGINTHDVG